MENLDLKILVLKHLRNHFQKAAVSRAPSPLSIYGIAAEVGVTVPDVKGMIAELVEIGYAKPRPNQPVHFAIEGECEITAAGLAFLEQYEARWHEPDEARKPIGFRLSS